MGSSSGCSPARPSGVIRWKPHESAPLSKTSSTMSASRSAFWRLIVVPATTSGTPIRLSAFIARIAASKAAGLAAELVVVVARPVEADRGHHRRVLLERVEVLLDAPAVGVDGPRHAAAVGVLDDLREVLAQERLAAGDDEDRPVEPHQLIDDPSPSPRRWSVRRGTSCRRGSSSAGSAGRRRRC